MSLNKIYDSVYENISGYDTAYTNKLTAVKNTLPLDKNTSILDIGCGKGHYTRYLKDLGYNNIQGVEFSQYCCENYLKDLTVINEDWLELGPTLDNDAFDLAICMDVLEHIEPLNIRDFIKNIQRTCVDGIFGIANHSDFLDGNELHLIQEGIVWWGNLLCEYYSKVELIFEAFPNSSGDPKFFMFMVDR